MKQPVTWKIGQNQELILDRTYIMGILNVTPDSFSDGGNYADTQTAIARAYEMAAQGADIIDIGGQSTRPGHIPISPEEEWNRIAPVLRELCTDKQLIISVDTYYPEVALKAMESGAQIINDVTGFREPLMREYAARYKVGCVIMHDIQLDENDNVLSAGRAYKKKSSALTRESASERATGRICRLLRISEACARRGTPCWRQLHASALSECPAAILPLIRECPALSLFTQFAFLAAPISFAFMTFPKRCKEQESPMLLCAAAHHWLITEIITIYQRNKIIKQSMTTPSEVFLCHKEESLRGGIFLSRLTHCRESEVSFCCGCGALSCCGCGA